MIVGIGTDIVHIPRIEAILAEKGMQFIQRILTEPEAEALQKSSKPAEFLAARFASKEAAAKALGTGFRGGLSYLHIRVMNVELHRPVILFSEMAQQMADKQRVHNAHLSISHDGDFAVAFVVLETA